MNKSNIPGTLIDNQARVSHKCVLQQGIQDQVTEEGNKPKEEVSAWLVVIKYFENPLAMNCCFKVAFLILVIIVFERKRDEDVAILDLTKSEGIR